MALSGFGAIEYLDSGGAGTRPFGGFAIRESSLFVEAKTWDNVALFLEVQVNRLGKDKELFVRTGEAYVVWRNLLGRWGDDLLHLKAGRVDIPFGEDYLWQDTIDNPLISFTAAYPYGFDEGVVLFGTLKGVGWVAALTDGTDDRHRRRHARVPLRREDHRGWARCVRIRRPATATSVGRCGVSPEPAHAAQGRDRPRLVHGDSSVVARPYARRPALARRRPGRRLLTARHDLNIASAHQS